MRITRVLPYSAVFAASLLLVPSVLPLAQTHPDDRFWTDPFAGVCPPNEYTDAIVPHAGGVLLGGLFSAVCETPVLRIARWERREWHPVGTGVGTADMGLVHVIRRGDGVLYAGGMFDQLGPWGASSVPRWGNIARFDLATESWLPLGDGMDRAVRGISVAANGDVYCVGEFTTAGSAKAQGVARWDGTSWHDVGGSLGPRARALAVTATADGVYVGGYFDRAGDTPVSYIARWNGERWEPLGAGVNDIVTAITVHAGRVYAGGAFTQAGGKAANRIAVWDGREWRAFGDGLSGPGLTHVRGIEIDIDQLYVTGTFTHAAGKEVGYVATWDGSEWLPLGSGVNDQTKVAVLHDGMVWVGGNFTRAGGKEIAYVATWTRPGKNTVTFDRVRARRTDAGVRVAWSFTAYGPWVGARLERRTPGGEFETVARAVDAASGDFLDEYAAARSTYDYALVVERANGTEARSEPVRVDAAPARPWLAQNQPNPFNPATIIRFGLPQASRVSIAVYDVTGRHVRSLLEADREPGAHDVTWDGRDDRGTAVAAGVYFYRMTARGETITRKMILVK